MAKFLGINPADLSLSPGEETSRRVAVQATASTSPVPFAPINDPPAIYTHIGHDAQYGVGRRNGRTVRLLIMHTTEGDGFLNGLAYAARRPELVSSNAYVGGDGEIGYGVPEDCRAYTTGRWNDESLSCEIFGRAIWSADQWHARPAQLEGIVRLLVDWCRRYSIPPLWLNRDSIAAGASLQSETPRQGFNFGICDHLEANLAARLLGATTSSTTHSDVGPALRNILINELIPEVARRLGSQEDDDDMEFIQVSDNGVDDTAIYLRSGITITWCEAHVDEAAVAGGFVASTKPRKVPRLALKCLVLYGAVPNNGTNDASMYRQVIS